MPTHDPPPGETTNAWYVGNGKIWAGVWPGGVILARPSDMQPDGSISMKFPFWRAAPGGPLALSGRRLDAPAGPASAVIPSGYGYSGFQATGLNFPSPGCWELTATAGSETLTFVTEVRAPAP